MKKLLNKVRAKKEPTQPPSSVRITNETVAEHRERILAGGRKFKYPVQYARHRLVLNAIAISVAALLVIVALGWWQLYPAQNTSNFMYRITKIAPLPVASVEGELVKYSDYLMKYRSAIHYLQQKEQVNLTSEDGKRQVAYTKQQAMQDAVADTYAIKLARQYDVSVSDAELESFLKTQRQSTDGEISQQTYDAVILDYYGWTPEEYRHATRVKLLRQKVSFAMDEDAQSRVDDFRKLLETRSDAELQVIVEEFNKDVDEESAAELGSSGWVPRNNQDGGLSVEAAKLTAGAISAPVKSTIGDGYYFVRLVDINATQLNYEYVKIPLEAFYKQLEELKENNGVKYYITLPEVSEAQQ